MRHWILAALLVVGVIGGAACSAVDDVDTRNISITDTVDFDGAFATIDFVVAEWTQEHPAIYTEISEVPLTFVNPSPSTLADFKRQCSLYQGTLTVDESNTRCVIHRAYEQVPNWRVKQVMGKIGQLHPL